MVAFSATKIISQEKRTSHQPTTRSNRLHLVHKADIWECNPVSSYRTVLYHSAQNKPSTLWAQRLNVVVAWLQDLPRLIREYSLWRHVCFVELRPGKPQTPPHTFPLTGGENMPHIVHKLWALLGETPFSPSSQIPTDNKRMCASCQDRCKGVLQGLGSLRAIGTSMRAITTLITMFEKCNEKSNLQKKWQIKKKLQF